MPKKFFTLFLVMFILFGGTTVAALTNEEALAQLQSLYNMLAAFQAQIQALQSGAASPSPASAILPDAPKLRCIYITSDLSLGKRDAFEGGPVSFLQRFLKSTGDYDYPEITGYFGVVTQAALQKTQARAGIVSSGTAATTGYGVAGPKTRAYIQARSCASQNAASAAPAPPSSGCVVNGIAIEDGASRNLYSAQSLPAGLACEQYLGARTCAGGILGGDAKYQYASCSVLVEKSCAVASTTIASKSSRTFYDRSSVSPGDTCDAHKQARTCTNGVLSGNASFSKLSCTGPRSCTLDGATIADGASSTFYFAQHVPLGELCSAYGITRSCSDGTLGGDAFYKYSSCAPIASSMCVADNIVLESGSSTTFYSAFAAPAGQACASIAQTRSCANGALSGNASYNRASCNDTASCTLDGANLSHGASHVFYKTRSVAFGTTCSSASLSRACTNGALSGDAAYKYSSCTVASPSSCVLDGAIIAADSSGVFYKARTVPYDSSCSPSTRTCTDGVLGGDASFQYASCEVSAPPSSSTSCDAGGNSGSQSCF